MTFKYGVPRGVAFSGGQVTDENPLKSVWASDTPCWQFVQYTPKSPAQSSNSIDYPDYQWTLKTFVDFRSFGVSVYRAPLRQGESFICIPPEKMALVQSLWRDIGRTPETVENFSINVFAPIGVGFYWVPRQVIWEFDPSPAV